MIFPCTAPPDAIYANTKGRKISVANSRTKRLGQLWAAQAVLVGEIERWLLWLGWLFPKGSFHSREFGNGLFDSRESRAPGNDTKCAALQ